jgi:hypothetical protein
MDALNWRKASYSASNGGCVEVGGGPGAVLVRDTQDRTGPVLRFSSGAWRKFADQVKRSLAPEPYGSTRVSCCCYRASSRRWAATRFVPKLDWVPFTGRCPMHAPLVRRRPLLGSACAVGAGACHRRDLPLARL